MVMVNFAAFAPDQDTLNSDSSADVLNVLCAAKSYIPAKSLLAITEALPGKPVGAFTARSLSGQVSVFAGTVDKLYKLNNTTLAWDDVSQTLTTYSAVRWSFAQVGEYVVAVNVNDDPQRFLLETDTEFSTLAGSPPRAAIVRPWGDFLVLMQLANNPNRAHWSGLNNIEFWTPGSQNCDFQDFPDGGLVQGSNSATNPIIFLERAIYVGQFVPGSAEIFAFQKIHDKRGAKSEQSIASRGAYTFYADEGGFFQIAPSGEVAPIGREKVDRTTFENLAASDIANILGVVDPFHSRVYFAIDDDGDGYYDRVLIYDWDLQKWSQMECDVSVLFPAALLGYTLEGLDALGYTLDTLPFSLDSKVWQGGAPVLAAFNASHELGFFNGPSLAATITTQETGSVTGQVSFLDGAFPVCDTNSATLQVGTRQKRGDDLAWGGEIAQNEYTAGFDFLSEARFHRFRYRIPAGDNWTHAQGLDLPAKGAGWR